MSQVKQGKCFIPPSLFCPHHRTSDELRRAGSRSYFLVFLAPRVKLLYFTLSVRRRRRTSVPPLVRALRGDSFSFNPRSFPSLAWQKESPSVCCFFLVASERASGDLIVVIVFVSLSLRSRSASCSITGSKLNFSEDTLVDFGLVSLSVIDVRFVGFGVRVKVKKKKKKKKTERTGEGGQLRGTGPPPLVVGWQPAKRLERRREIHFNGPWTTE